MAPTDIDFTTLSANAILEAKLKERTEKNSLRSLSHKKLTIDFCSNDYLGFARSKKLFDKIKTNNLQSTNGSGGSRLLAGNTEYAEQLEDKIAKKFHAEAGLIFNSGYDANLGLFSCVARRGDTILFDELAHASIRDGIRLSLANSFSFHHNDLKDLERKLQKAKGLIFVSVESVYSMDGDTAPLHEIIALCKKYNANLIVDEAHAIGVVGTNGEGLVSSLKLENEVFARLITFGKALGVHGAIVVGSTTLRNYLINYARSFIYTTALPMHSLVSIDKAFELLDESASEVKKIKSLSDFFNSTLESEKNINFIKTNSAIKSIVVSGNEKVKLLANKIQENNMDVRPILSPTVPENKERLRICLHSFNNEQEILKLVEIINTFYA